jgi:hypothetical protein
MLAGVSILAAGADEAAAATATISSFSDPISLRARFGDRVETQVPLVGFSDLLGVLSGVTLSFSGSVFGQGEGFPSGLATFTLGEGSFSQQAAEFLNPSFGPTDLLSDDNLFREAYELGDFIGDRVVFTVSLGRVQDGVVQLDGTLSLTYTYDPVSVIPLPASLPMLGAAFAGVAGWQAFRRRRG